MSSLAQKLLVWVAESASVFGHHHRNFCISHQVRILVVYEDEFGFAMLQNVVYFVLGESSIDRSYYCASGEDAVVRLLTGLSAQTEGVLTVGITCNQRSRDVS